MLDALAESVGRTVNLSRARLLARELAGTYAGEVGRRPSDRGVRDANVLHEIRRRAANEANILTPAGQHAAKRMSQRGFTRTQIARALRTGVLAEPAHRNVHGDIECVIERRSGADDIRVPVILPKARTVSS
jgi:hypothetical protein